MQHGYINYALFLRNWFHQKYLQSSKKSTEKRHIFIGREIPEIRNMRFRTIMGQGTTCPNNIPNGLSITENKHKA